MYDFEILTCDEFLTRAQAGDLPAYCGAPYFPAWLAPDGKVVIGETHLNIAREVVGASDYDAMFRAGHIRVVPDKHLSNLSIQAEHVHATTAQKVTLTKLVMAFELGGDSYISSHMGTKAARDRVEFLQRAQAVLA